MLHLLLNQRRKFIESPQYSARSGQGFGNKRAVAGTPLNQAVMTDLQFHPVQLEAGSLSGL